MFRKKSAEMEFSKITRVIKMIFTNFLILYVLLYYLEIILQFNSGYLFKKTKFYYQSKLENQSRAEVVLSFDPYKFLNKNKKINPDVIFNALHGKDGEDGNIQSSFEYLKIPYTHSGVLSSMIAMDKFLSKKFFEKNNIKPI